MFVDVEQKTSILVVDPDPTLRARLDAMFNGDPLASLKGNEESLTYRILGCINSETAFDHVASAVAEGAQIPLVFVESQLADGDSLALISRFWLIDNDLHVVLCNDDPAMSWTRIVETLGESDQLLILEKPFSDLELRQIVNAMMRKWQLSEQSEQVMQFMDHQIQLRTQEIQEANKNLLQSEKLAAVGQLAAGIAHEINTPAQYVGDNIRAIGDFFTSITRLLEFYRQMLSRTGSEDLLNKIREQESQEDLAFILEDAPLALQQSLEGMGQIVRIVQAMKGFSHVGQSRASNININLALENTLLVARNSYKYIADIETEFAELPLVECFPGELNQVFLNIVVNAAQAIEDNKQGRGQIIIRTLALDDGVEVAISDTGGGIPEAIRDRIFDPFFTTKDVGRGTGQGLNIAYSIINEQHGGSLTFKTESGVGTTFFIRLKRYLPKDGTAFANEG